MKNDSVDGIIEELLFDSQQCIEMMREKTLIDEEDEVELLKKKATKPTRTVLVSPREMAVGRRTTERKKAAQKNRNWSEQKKDPYYGKPRRARRINEMSYKYEVKRNRLTDISLRRALEEYYAEIAYEAEIEAEQQVFERIKYKRLRFLEMEIAFCRLSIKELECDIERDYKLLNMEADLEMLPGKREAIIREIESKRIAILSFFIRLNELKESYNFLRS